MRKFLLWFAGSACLLMLCVGEIEAQSSKTLFTILPPEKTGVTFKNIFVEDLKRNFWNYTYAFNGAGVAVVDLNNDGLPDIFFASNTGDNTLYLNKGNMQFEDVSKKAGVKVDGFCTGVTYADVNADGWMDLYVSRTYDPDQNKRSNLLYINNHDMTFTESAAKYGIQDSKNHHSDAVFFDYDLDGDLDLYCLNYPTDFDDKGKFTTYVKIEKGMNESDQFYINNGDGTFTNISKQAGINDNAYGLSCTVGDVNMDGYPDLYIGNDFAMPDFLYINNGKGGFIESERTNLKKLCFYGMGSDIADINNDTYPDIMCVDMRSRDHVLQYSQMEAMVLGKFEEMVTNGYYYQYGRNTLQLNNGNGTFAEIANFSGVDGTEWSWSPLFMDVDNDGLRDLFVSNGYYLQPSEDLRNYTWQIKAAIRNNDSISYWKTRGEYEAKIGKAGLKKVNCFFKNNDGLKFTCEPDQLADTTKTYSYGAAYADLDNDGDVDLVTNNSMNVAFIYQNNTNDKSKGANNYLNVNYVGIAPNTFAVGAKVIIQLGDKKEMAENFPNHGYLSASQNQSHFGLGTAKTVDKLTVYWPNGKMQVMTNVKANQTLTVDESKATNARDDLKPVAEQTFFTDITQKIKMNFTHFDRDYKDYDRELMLPHKMSQYGPGIAVGDINGDGLEDFIIGNGQGVAAKIYVQNTSGGFDNFPSTALTLDQAKEKMGLLLFDADGDGDNDLYVSAGSNEFDEGSINLVDHLFLNDGKGNLTLKADGLPLISRSTSCVTAADYDNDGDLDLFIGVRSIPGHYPEPASSYILQNNGKGVFTDVTATVAPMLNKIGLVCSSLWTDYDNDGDKDLMIVGEWMPLTVLQNNNGVFSDKTNEYGLENTTGWWNSLIGGDFDNDGDIDYVAGNQGANFRYTVSDKYPFQVYYGDWDKNGHKDIIMAIYDNGILYPMKARRWSTEQIPSLAQKYPSYHDFGTATLEDIYGKAFLDTTEHFEAKTFLSSFIRNDGNGHFTVVPLPEQAQLSNIYGMLAEDYDGDGNLDLLVHGNFYYPEIETDRFDGNIGLLMLGDGKGNFKPLTSMESGFYSPDDAKSLVEIYTGINNQPGVLATANEGPLRVFAFNNPSMMKIMDTKQTDSYCLLQLKSGKVRRQEIYCGSGYLSESSRKLLYPVNQVSKIEMVDYLGKKKEL